MNEDFTIKEGKDFTIKDGIYLVSGGDTLDLHNNYDFTGVTYSVAERRATLTWGLNFRCADFDSLPPCFSWKNAHPGSKSIKPDNKPWMSTAHNHLNFNSDRVFHADGQT